MHPMNQAIWRWLLCTGMALAILAGAPSCGDKTIQDEANQESAGDGGNIIDQHTNDTPTTEQPGEPAKEVVTPDQIADQHVDQPGATDTVVDRTDLPDDPPQESRADTPQPDLQALQCGPRSQRYRGTICGTTASPCQILSEEIVSDRPKSRSSEPGIALDAQERPHVIFNENVGGFSGFHSIRTGPNQWQESKMSLPAATTTLVSNKHGQISAYTYDGAFGNTIWHYTQGQWKTLYQWKGSYGAKRQTIDSDDAGCLHLTYKDKDKPSTHVATYSNAQWSARFWDTVSYDQSAVIRLSSTGAPHVAFWGYQNGTSNNGLFWSNDANPPTQIEPRPTNVQGQTHLFLEVIDAQAYPKGQAHILTTQSPQSGQSSDLLYLAQTAAGGWTRTVLATSTNKACPIPQSTGQVCEYDYTIHTPIAMVHGGSIETLRMLYTSTQYKGKLTSTCTTGDRPAPPPAPAPVPPPPFQCTWGGDQSTTTTLQIAWLEAGAIKQSSVSTDMQLTSAADVQLDHKGNIHMTFLGLKPTSPNPANPAVMYWMLGIK